MLSVNIFECHNAECHNAECLNAECHDAKCHYNECLDIKEQETYMLYIVAMENF
jgi:hypothetical protein